MSTLPAGRIHYLLLSLPERCCPALCWTEPGYLREPGGPPKSLCGKVHTPLASRFSIRRIMATSMKLSLLCTSRS